MKVTDEEEMQQVVTVQNLQVKQASGAEDTEVEAEGADSNVKTEEVGKDDEDELDANK